MIAAVFLFIELLYKKGYVFWLAVLAIVNYLVLSAVSFWMAGLVFVILAPLTSLAWYLYLNRKIKRYEQLGYVRDSHDYVRSEFVLSQPMVDGKTEINLDDSIWPVYAREDISLPTGARVKVIKTNGVILIVKPVKA